MLYCCRSLCYIVVVTDIFAVSSLHGVDSDLVADFTVVIWKIDNQIPRECSTLSIGFTLDLHICGCFDDGESNESVSLQVIQRTTITVFCLSTVNTYVLHCVDPAVQWTVPPTRTGATLWKRRRSNPQRSCKAI